MQTHITARHLELTPAISDYVGKKLDRVARHFAIVLRSQVILSVEKHRHAAELVVHAQGHHDFRVKEVAGDLYAAIDLAAETLHKHFAREKDRRVRGRRETKAKIAAPLTADASLSAVETRDPVIARISRLTPKSLTVAQAARELDQSEYDFLLFFDESEILKVLYRRKDGTYGLLEPNL